MIHHYETDYHSVVFYYYESSEIDALWCLWLTHMILAINLYLNQIIYCFNLEGLLPLGFKLIGSKGFTVKALYNYFHKLFHLQTILSSRILRLDFF